MSERRAWTGRRDATSAADVGLRGQHLRHLDRVRAFPLIAVQVLHSTAFAVSLLEAAGLTVAALAAVALAPWVERRAKRPVMVAADLTRFLATASVPLAYGLGVLTYGQLLIVSVRVGTAGIVFTAASGAYLKHLVRGEHLLVANARFEGTSWMATRWGHRSAGRWWGCSNGRPPSPSTPSAFCCRARNPPHRGDDVALPRDPIAVMRAGDLLAGWRFILHTPCPALPVLNSVAVGG